MFILGQLFRISEEKIRKPAENHQPVHCSLIKHFVLAILSVLSFLFFGLKSTKNLKVKKFYKLGAKS